MYCKLSMFAQNIEIVWRFLWCSGCTQNNLGKSHGARLLPHLIRRACNSMRQCQALCFIWKTEHFIYTLHCRASYYYISRSSEQQRLLQILMYAQYCVSVSTFAPIFHTLHRYFIPFYYYMSYSGWNTCTYACVWLSSRYTLHDICLGLPSQAYNMNEKPNHWIVYSFWIFHAR